MNKILKGVTVSVALVGLLAVPVSAQTGWGSLGLHASWLNPGEIAEGPTESLNWDETFGLGADLDFWFGQARRWGLGFEGTWTNGSELDTSPGPLGGDYGSPVDIWQYDASLQVRLARPTMNTRVLPWLSLGAGGYMVNPDDESESPFPLVIEEADVRLDTESHTEFAIVGGIGLDFFLSPGVALRLEAKDYYTHDSPYQRLSSAEFHDGGHNLLFNAGLAFHFGGRQVEEPGFVREEPEVVVVAPRPEPVIVEENITVCVVDDDGYDLRTVQAIRIPSRNETVVMQNGQRVAFSTVYPTTSPLYAKSSTWYMNDQPLVVYLDDSSTMTDRNRLEFVRFGTAARRPASDLVFVGTINGTPVYGARADVQPFQTRLERHLSMHGELGDIFDADPELAVEFGEINSLYVPVEPDCVFQPVSTTHFVRRTRG